MHRKIMDYFRLYLIIGGMPQAVLEYIETKSFSNVDRVKRQILNLYYNCIDQYAGIHSSKVKAIYENIPGQLQLHEHKFQLSDLSKDARFLLMENIVAQMLTALGCKLFFFSNPSRTNKDDRMEIDFLIAKSVISSRHNISALEVKSSSGFTTVSLEKCMKKYETHMAQPYVIHTGDLESKKGFLFIPLYMVPCLE